MIPVKQSHSKGCFQACVASMLGLPLNDVPDFCAPGWNGHDWWGGFLKWCEDRGFHIIEFRIRYDTPCFAEMPDGMRGIMSGKSPRGLNHSVIGITKQNEILVEFDPHESGDGLSGQATDVLFFVPVSVSAIAEKDKRIAELETFNETFKRLFNEYSDCLQTLCMGVMYEACKPLSHKWPGKPHVETVVEGVNHLISRIAELERQLAEANEANKKLRDACALLSEYGDEG